MTVYLHPDCTLHFRTQSDFQLLPLNKSDLRRQIIARLQSELQLQTSAAQLARDEAISEESRPENKYDTHSQEAAYLAEGQAKLAAEIQASIAIYQTLALPDFDVAASIGIGALVELSVGGKSAWYFLGPRAGGLELALDNQSVLLITPQSPLGRQLLGRKVGDRVQPPGRGTPMAQDIRSVR